MREEALKLRMCEICQQISYIDDLEKFIQVIKECKALDRYAYIIHDKDLTDDGSIKAAHIHVMIKFAYSYNVLALAKQLNLESQYVGKIQSRNFEDALLYLTHLNSAEKYQCESELVTANFEYSAICERYLKKKESTTKSLSEKEQIKAHCQEIIDGKIKRFNYYELIDNDFCVRYRTRFENAFKVRDDITKNKGRELEVMYFTGDSGTGKTTLAKQIATQKAYSYYISSSSNDLLDGYAGQDCLILDDLRPSCLSLADLLKLLDNHTASTAKSRYYNKILECKLIIITTVINIEDFFSNVFQEHSEPLVQLKRRCATYFEFSKNEIRVSSYDASIQDYKYINTIENPIAKIYPKVTVNKDDTVKKLKDLLGDSYNETSTEDWLIAKESPFPID